jgi:hypothetical protein
MRRSTGCRPVSRKSGKDFRRGGGSGCGGAANFQVSNCAYVIALTRKNPGELG